LRPCPAPRRPLRARRRRALRGQRSLRQAAPRRGGSARTRRPALWGRRRGAHRRACGPPRHRRGGAGALIGGLAGPVLMLSGLQRLPAVTGSLLLNLEAPFTMLLAVSAFREHLSAKEAAGGALVIAGGAALGLQPGALGGSWAGAA